MSDYFPEEIIQRILLRLPIKSLIKFTAVCKSWMSLIKSSTFIQSHLRGTIDSDAHFLLLSAFSYNRRADNSPHHWLHWDSPEFGEYSKLPNPVTFLKHSRVSDVGVVGTCNGLVYLKAVQFDSDRSTLIWNPCIRKIVMLPSPPSCVTSSEFDRNRTHGFGYDSHSNDYKVLRIVTLVNNLSHLSRTVAQVYSLARGSWKSLSASDIPIDFHGGFESPAFISGNLHTLEARSIVYYYGEEQRKYAGDRFIASFNLATEVFGEIIIPEALQNESQDRCSIKRYGDSIALIKRYDFRDLVNRGCDIWVMKEYGVAESWTYLFNIDVVWACIYGFKRCGEVVLWEYIDRSHSRMVSLDPKSKRVKVYKTKGYTYDFMDSFVESLVMLDHANAISYPVARKEERG